MTARRAMTYLQQVPHRLRPVRSLLLVVPVFLFLVTRSASQITETRVVEVSNGPAGKGGYGTGTPAYEIVAAVDTKLFIMCLLLAILVLIEVSRELRAWGSMGE